MSSQPTIRRTLKCPSCNYKHFMLTKPYGDHSVQLNIACEIFGVTAECPVCLDECSGFMALPCGHILCKDDYQRMGGMMPTPSDPNRYKVVCEVDLRRSDATITRPPLTLTFREPTTDPGSSVPARSATHTHPTSVSTTNAYPTSVSTVTVNEMFESTNTSVAEHSSSLSHIESGWAAFNNAMRRMEETFSRAPFVSDGSSGASNRGNGARDAASHRPTSSINATTSTITAAGLTGATNVQQFSFGHRPTSSINTTTSTITAAGLTGATNVRASVAASPRSNLSANELLEAIHVPLPAQLISGGQGNGASVAETHRTAAGTNAPSSVLTAAELSGARRPQPPIPTIPALPWYEIARPQLPTQTPRIILGRPPSSHSFLVKHLVLA